MLLSSHIHPFIFYQKQIFQMTHIARSHGACLSRLNVTSFGVYLSLFVQKHACAGVFEHVGGCLWVWTDGSGGDQEHVCSCRCWWETGMILASLLRLRIPGDKPTLGLPSDRCCSYCRWFQGPHDLQAWWSCIIFMMLGSVSGSL